MDIFDNRHTDRADVGGGFDGNERWGSGMTEQEREELIEKMVRALAQSHVNGLVYQDTARAALAVAEPVIREQCAKIAEKGNDETCWTASERAIATAIREGGENA